eukprot:4714205-Pleurochrysis_carterae.AAC.2
MEAMMAEKAAAEAQASLAKMAEEAQEYKAMSSEERSRLDMELQQPTRLYATGTHLERDESAALYGSCRYRVYISFASLYFEQRAAPPPLRYIPKHSRL